MAVKRLSETEKHEIAERYRQPHESTATLARAFGVSTSTIGRLLKSSFESEEYEVLVRQKRSIGRGGAGRMSSLMPSLAPAQSDHSADEDFQPSLETETSKIETSQTEIDVGSAESAIERPEERLKVVQIIAAGSEAEASKAGDDGTELADDTEVPTGVVVTHAPTATLARLMLDPAVDAAVDAAFSGGATADGAHEDDIAQGADRKTRRTRTRSRARSAAAEAPADSADQLGLSLTAQRETESGFGAEAPVTVEATASHESSSRRRRRRSSARASKPDATSDLALADLPMETSTNVVVVTNAPMDERDTQVATSDDRAELTLYDAINPEPDTDSGLPETLATDTALEVYALEPQDETAPLGTPPLSAAELPKTCYLVVDRLSELVSRPLQDFGELGEIPAGDDREQTLPVFDNHRVARRFANRSQRVMKIPDSRVLQKTEAHLQAKGITRVLIDGKIYSLA